MSAELNEANESCAEISRRIYIIAAEPILRYAFRSLCREIPGITVGGEAESLERAIPDPALRESEALLLHISGEEPRSFAALERLTQLHPALPVVVTADLSEESTAGRLLQAGALTLVPTKETLDQFVLALRGASTGHVHVSPMLSERIIARMAGIALDPKVASLDRLSAREREVLRLLGQANTTRQIAAMLGLSIKTVETHRARMKEKLGFRNALELIRFAVETAV